ncbi:septum formation protein Maf [Geovibrio thiophilus]|uniref:dTTP/UTP pyrophosphatase n=1 Tax=Geovibrio thiophilus TaxID=139438 RepID=A0A3R5Y764_9BACT|nr:Maf family protein [Geovibrio thiophilus]QAR33359.1 septum formation protein Maf [Geovibrio thiophilus]
MIQKIILASGSPRRRELMTRIGLNFQYVTSDIKEDLTDDPDFGHQAMRLAAMKAYNVANIYDEAYIIGADTIVVLDGVIYGKPTDAADAKNTLRALSGKQHKVITGVALVNKREGLCERFYESTDVYFRKYGDDFIDWYIETEEPFDKAGSYAIQGKGCLLVEKIEGDYDNVVGLPVSRLFQHLIKSGIRPGGLHEF